jgi:hypothetical protein
MSTIVNRVFNPLNPYKAPSPSTQRRIDGKHGEEAIVNVNISIREEKAQDAKQALEEAIAHLDRDEYIGGAY